MKRKYYLRGLGFGILITSLVFIFTGSDKTVSDEEVIKRATELGYVKVEENVSPTINLEELKEKTTPAPTATATPTPSPTVTPLPTLTPVPTLTLEPTATPTPIPTATPVPTAVPTEAPAEKVVTARVVVESGNTAGIVCEKLRKAGILESSEEFNFRLYLNQNNYSNRINVGTYTLSSDMTFEELAEILTGH